MALLSLLEKKLQNLPFLHKMTKKGQKGRNGPKIESVSHGFWPLLKVNYAKTQNTRKILRSGKHDRGKQSWPLLG